MSLILEGEAKIKRSVCVVLSRTTHPGNIGAVARAMKNMGLSELLLVNPSSAREENSEGELVDIAPQSSLEAVRRSSGATDILEQARIFSCMEDALADFQVVIGASARTRKMPWPLIDPKQAAEVVMQTVLSASTTLSVCASPGEDLGRVALVFGNEASGLSNDELQLCQYHVNIPAVESFASLNLAMAVQLVCYEVRMALLSLESSGKAPIKLGVSDIKSTLENGPGELANFSELDGLLSHYEETLVKIGYLDPDNPRQLMPKLRRLFSRTQLEKAEVNILRGILKATQKYGH